MAEGDPAVPSYVRVPVDSTGKYMRNVQLTVMQPDGTTPDTQMEVVCLADDQGKILRFDDWQQVVQLQTRTNELLELILAALTG